MRHQTKPIALKEWAVAVKALRSGEQILIMRKGGIREETREFEVKNDSFYLFPTYEHQKKQWIKPAFQQQLERTFEDWSSQDTEVSVSCYAKLQEDILIQEQEQLVKLAGEHIWTDTFAEERLKWRRINPLHVMLLRVYELRTPLRLPILASYNGCKSWIQLEADNLDGVERQPVLDDAAFNYKLDRIKTALS